MGLMILTGTRVNGRMKAKNIGQFVDWHGHAKDVIFSKKAMIS